MLLELSIKDFAIIESLSIGFGPGLNIFTGETGAGKSIILDAIALILGDRASNELIREGREEAQVQALFDISGQRKSINGVLSEAGIEPADELIIKRVVQRAGRNRIYINGSLATLVTLTEIGRRLIDIYGQSEHTSLTRPEEHIEVLDSFGGFPALRSYMAQTCKEYGAARKELDTLLSEARSASEKKDYLSFQLNELTEADLKPGEEEALKKGKEKLAASGKLRSAAEEAHEAIYSSAGSVTERLGSIARSLKELSSIDPKLSDVAGRIEASLFDMEDAGVFLRDYASSIEADPEALEAAADRLDFIGRLRKKYGGTIEEIIERKDKLEKELSIIENLDFRQAELEARVKASHDKALKAAEGLTDARKAASRELESRIDEELSTLGMKGAAFEVSIEPELFPDGTARLTEKGAERVSFMIATNKGEGLKPLARIASGGELSRIMLAMKSIIASGRVPTMIFDEIDTGVSGSIAQVVGLKLKEVSRTNQVLCITHLPQVAAFADRHFAVSKAQQGGRTTTSVAEIAGDERVGHISLMLGGLKVTDTTRKHASELIEAAGSLSKKKSQPQPKKQAQTVREEKK